MKLKIKGKDDEKEMKNKKSEFQKEIEADEKRLEEIYNKILGGLYYDTKD